jgi:hypothetical protein
MDGEASPPNQNHSHSENDCEPPLPRNQSGFELLPAQAEGMDSFRVAPEYEKRYERQGGRGDDQPHSVSAPDHNKRSSGEGQCLKNPPIRILVDQRMPLLSLSSIAYIGRTLHLEQPLQSRLFYPFDVAGSPLYKQLYAMKDFFTTILPPRDGLAVVKG